MSRKARKNLCSNYAHIMVQGINREYIFNNEKNMKKYKDIIVDNLRDSEIIILSYCIMNNHTHFMMFYDEIDILSKFMHKVNSAYSMYYNRINDRVGYVFRDRFKVQEIIDRDQLYNCLRYIHNNPVKAKICSTMDEYKYSSYNEFLGKKQIINDKSIELLFGDNSDYKGTFEIIHNNCKHESFIDLVEMSFDEFITEYTKKRGLGINDIRNNKRELEMFIKETRNKTDASLVEIAHTLDMSKSQVGFYSNK